MDIKRYRFTFGVVITAGSLAAMAVSGNALAQEQQPQSGTAVISEGDTIGEGRTMSITEGTETGSQSASGEAMQAGSAPAFSEIDANEDGVISREEAQGDQKLVAGWQDADTDGSDDISESEFSAFQEEQADMDVGGDEEAGVVGTENGDTMSDSSAQDERAPDTDIVE